MNLIYTSSFRILTFLLDTNVPCVYFKQYMLLVVGHNFATNCRSFKRLTSIYVGKLEILMLPIKVRIVYGFGRCTMQCVHGREITGLLCCRF